MDAFQRLTKESIFTLIFYRYFICYVFNMYLIHSINCIAICYFYSLQDSEAEAKLRAQYAMFHCKDGVYGYPATKGDAVTMSPIKWWSTLWM